jgi:uncharacterized protein (DUF3084 family)
MFSTTPIILVLGLVLATCVIAYWSDNLGKKLGKKRISLMGLRPRQTATLISMVSSVAIMLVTLIILTLFSESVRNALLYYDDVKRDNNSLKRNNDSLRTQAATLRQSVEDNQKKAQQAGKQAANARRLAGRAAIDVEDAEKKLSVVRGNLTKAERARQAAQRSEQDARRGERMAESQEREAKRREGATRKRLQANEENLQIVSYRLNDTSQKLALGEQQLVSVTKQRDSIKRQVTILQRQVRRLGKDNLVRTLQYQKKIIELERAERRLAEIERKVQEKEREVQEKELKVRQLQVVADELFSFANGQRITIGYFGQGKLAISLGQVFAEGRLPAGMSEAGTIAALRVLLDSGAEAAERLGGKPYFDAVEYGNSANRALHLARLRSQSGSGLNEEEQIQNFAKLFSKINVPASVRLMAVRNYAVGEDRFEAQLVVVPVRRAFADGETIAQIPVDGYGTEVELMSALRKLVSLGESVATSRRVQPLLNDQSPYFFAEGTEARIFDAMRDIQNVSRKVKVTLVADGDISTVDTMRVRFVIEPA